MLIETRPLGDNVVVDGDGFVIALIGGSSNCGCEGGTAQVFAPVGVVEIVVVVVAIAIVVLMDPSSSSSTRSQRPRLVVVVIVLVAVVVAIHMTCRSWLSCLARSNKLEIQLFANRISDEVSKNAQSGCQVSSSRRIPNPTLQKTLQRQWMQSLNGIRTTTAKTTTTTAPMTWTSKRGLNYY